MQFGFMVPRESDFTDGDDPYGRIYDFCQRAEELGFDFGTFTHHRFSPERPFLSQPFVMMSAVASRTSRLRLVTTVLVLPLYHPLDVAETVAQLDHVSGGRVVLGVGIGYREYEAAAVGVPFDRRVSRFTESIEILRRAWTEERISFAGRHFAFDDVEVVPKPVQRPRPPIWIGAMETKPIERAGRIADGWIAPSLQTTETLAAKAQRYRAVAAEHGRTSTVCLERDIVVHADRETAREGWLRRNGPLLDYYRSHGAPIPDFPDADPDSFEARSAGCAVAGTPDDVVAQLGRCHDELGHEHLSIMNMGLGPGYAHAGNYDHELAALELFGKEVIPAFR